MKEIYKRATHTIDATDQILGRLATLVATLLQGKNKPDYIPNVDSGDIVIIKNASKIRVTGNKYSDKIYKHHSNYPGGLKERAFKDVLAKDASEIIRLAVSRMLPKNKLKDKRLKRLKIEK
ncbi:MAG TPA: 50S ribosomal protein L13 [Candidatus Magasanikbacteria bacterium]|nr:50S ribosomal protein L13 [Candidatus Magasanikbacteria bacterium]